MTDSGMSKTHPTVEAYWKVAGPIVNGLLETRRDRATEDLLEHAIAAVSFVVQDFDEKRSKNQHLAGMFDALAILTIDLLRGGHAAQVYLSLIASALAARSAFELLVTLRFITTSATPDLYASRFHRFQNVEKLNRHYKAGLYLNADEIKNLTGDSSDWIDSKTGRPKKGCKWHGESFSIADLADKVNETEGYQSLYSMNSLFAHGSSIVQKLYVKDQKLQMLSDTKNVSRQSILVVGNCAKALVAHAEFFGVPLPQAEMMALVRRMNEITESL
jgi:Family of unknown function (DUF5677)